MNIPAAGLRWEWMVSGEINLKRRDLAWYNSRRAAIILEISHFLPPLCGGTEKCC